MENVYLKKIGKEKVKYFLEGFDAMYDFYLEKANKMGYEKIKLKKSKGIVEIYVLNVIENNHEKII